MENNINYTRNQELNLVEFHYNIDFRKKFHLLMTLIKSFEGLTWTFTCSFGLFMQGVVSSFNDFDVLVHPKDFTKLCEILDGIGSRKTYDKDPSRQGNFSSAFFAEYEVNGIDIDVISEFGINTFGCVYQHHLDNSQIETISFRDMNVPVVIAEAQFLFYGMMAGWQPEKRAKRRDQIAAYLKAGNMRHPEVLRDVIEEGRLPSMLLSMADDILQNAK